MNFYFYPNPIVSPKLRLNVLRCNPENALNTILRDIFQA